MPEGKTLTIQGSGTLNATANSFSAGIGSGRYGTCGNITISGGTINATGGRWAAGIGSSDKGTCGNITINGGIVTATGGYNGAGIGTGGESASCGNITISGGTVTATGGENGAGIGSSLDGSFGNVTITTSITRVTATKGKFAPYSIGNGSFDVGFGNTESTHYGTVTIGGIETGFIEQSPFTTYPYSVSFNANGGTGTMADMNLMNGAAQNLPANSFSREGSFFKCWNTKSDGSGNSYADGQAVSYLTTESEVTLYAQWFDGNLAELSTDFTAVNGMTLYGMLGANVKVSIANGATVTLSGATINGTNNDSYKWAGINCLGDATIILSGTNSVNGFHEDYPGIHMPKGKTLTIQGRGALTATSNGHGAGIGGGNHIDCGNITISGGTVTANGGNHAAGIGSGDFASCGNITISGGTVTANGGSNAAGIGREEWGSHCGNITITNGVTRVTATKGSDFPNSIGGHSSNEIGTVTLGCTLDNSGNPVGGAVTGNISTSPFTYDPTMNVVYAVSFDSNGGTGTAMSSMNYLYGLEMALPECTYTRTGYEFAGWSTTASGAVAYADGAAISTPTITNGAVTLYAQWTENVLELTDNASNATTIAAAAATYKTYNRVTLSGRTLYKDGNWNTLCLPFDVSDFAGTPLEGATVKTLTSTSFSNGILTMDFSNDLTSVEAGKPYIVKWAGGSNIANPVFSGVTIRNSTDNVSTTYVDFVGTYSPVVYSDVNRSVLFLGGGSTLYYPDGTAPTTIGAFRAYFELKNGLTAGDRTGVRTFVLNFGEDEETGISLTPDPSPKGEGSNYWYTLDGRRLRSASPLGSSKNGKPIQRGLYLNNGRKIVIK